jgi:glycosyltransferase involved in cell wall biosynthesis
VRLIVGTYRRRDHIDDCLESVHQHLHGVTDIVFVDDSGNPDHERWLTQHGKVISVGRRGYTAAMQHVCAAAQGQPAMFLEEDFTFLADVDLDELAQILHDRPYLAQVALLRGPHFDIEHEHGGLIEALQHKGHTFADVHGIIEQRATFTCNPAVWRGAVFAAGWPSVRWSEDRKRDLLLRQGYRFGYLPGIRVAHAGQRCGFGY